MMKARLLLLSLFAVAASLVVHAADSAAEAASIVRAEYFYDTDPGYGEATTINGVAEGDNVLTLSIDGLTPGVHLLNFRSQDSNGVWSQTHRKPFYLFPQRATQVARAEYFYDTDPGCGSGTPIASVVNGEQTLPLSIAGLTPGVHILFVRAQDQSGIWSHVAFHTLYILPAQTANVTRIEYFVDSDPGIGMATQMAASDGSDSYVLSLGDITPGAHLLTIRAQDNLGRWSFVQSQPFYVVAPSSDIVTVEYFFDASDPGEGKATPVTLPADLSEPFAFEANTDGLAEGEHTLNIRILDSKGSWKTITTAATFTVKEPTVAVKEPYAIVTDNTDEVSTTSGLHNGKTLTFYYDDKKTERGGMSVVPFSSTSSVAWYGSSDVISRAIFDDSFAECTTLTSTAYWFAQCRNLRTITGMGNLKTDNVTNMASMFDVCESLTELDVSGFNTSKVTSMERMFLACSQLTSLDLSSFNTANVTNMDLMFYHMFKVISIYASSEWDTSKVTTSDEMFGSCNALVGGASTQYSYDKLSHAYAHIDGGPENPGYFTVKGAPVPYAAKTVNADSDDSHDRYTLTFYYDTNIVERGGMSIGPIIEYNKRSWHSDANYITAAVFDKSFADYSNLLSTAHWFSYCNNLASVTGTENLKTDNLLVTTDMFYDCRALTTVDLTGINTSNVVYMTEMFRNCYSLTSLDLSNFNTAKVTNMNSMFYGCQSLTTIYASAGWSTESVEDGDYMFYSCSKLVGGAGTKFNYSHTGLDYAHIDGGEANPGYLTDKDAPVVTEPEAYAVLDGTTVTFYYDDKKAERGGMDINNSYISDDSTSPYGTATTAMFDASFADYRPTSTAYWFIECKLLTAITGIEYLHTDEVTSMHGMFYGCSSLTSLDVSGFNTANVTDMGSMFYECSGLTSLDVTKFNTTNVKNMHGMFLSCNHLTSLDVSNFNTSNVTDLSMMFLDCSKLTSLDVTNFNTANATTMNGMFMYCSSLTSLDVTKFNTANVTNMSCMFLGCYALTSIDVSNWNTANVTDMDNMFNECVSLNAIYAGSEWSTAAVTYSKDMFTDCTALIGGKGTVYDADHVDAEYARIDGGPTSETPGYFTDKDAPVVTEPEAYAVLDGLTLTFYYDDKKAERGGIDINNTSGAPSPYGTATTAVFDASFDTYRPTSTAYWFYRCSSLATITGIEYLHTDDVTTMYFMFSDCTGLTSLDVSHFNTANVTEMTNMFHNCSGLTSLDVSGLNTANVTDMDGMFAFCSSLTSLDLTNFNTANVTRMWGLFEGCSGLTSLDLTNFNTANVTDMTHMFYNCPGLTSLDLTNFNTANVTSMTQMFVSCSGLTSLDLTNFNTGNVLFMDRMFRDCSALTTIYAGSEWSTAAVTDGASMFYGCTNLVGGKGTVYDDVHVDAEYARIDGGPTSETPGYFTDRDAPVVTEPEAYAVLDGTTLTFYYDDQKAVRGGMSVGPFMAKEERPWHAVCSDITTAVFDHSVELYDGFTSTAYWFNDCNSLTAVTGMHYLHTQNVTDMGSMFWNCASLTSIDVSGFNTTNVKNMYAMFDDCASLTSLDVSNFDTRNVTSFDFMFRGCTGLTSLDVSNFSTKSAVRMTAMFHYCTGLQTLNVSSFNTANVIDMNMMFQGCRSLPVLDISSFSTAKVTDMGDIFVDCRSLASIVAGSADVPDEEYAKVENPNLLVYVDDASLAPAGIQNVVIGDVAKEIVLVDVTSGNNNFYVPKAFTTEKISYSHNFTQQTQPGVSRGWESLVLPFTVQTITHETHGELKPYKAAEGDKPFWLRTLTASGIKSAVRIVANMPYLISMPNNTEAYDEEYCQGGVVTFASASVTVPATKLTVAALSDSSIVMRPTLLRVPQSETVYALNIGEPRGTYAEGSVFERDYRDVRPFECYTMHKSGTGGSRFITLGDLNGGDATGIQEIDYADWAGDGAVYDLGGRRVDSSMVNGQWSKVKGQSSKLSKGVYIQNGRKRVVK